MSSTTTNPIRIILVDDHELIRESWKMLINREPGLMVIAQCSNGIDAIKLANDLQPDIVLMDINMSPVDGLEATKKIAEKTPSVKIIGVSANDNPRIASRMLSMGGKGFVTKTSSFEELKTAIRKVYDGEIYICHEIKRKTPDTEL